jgi:threonine dehydratase
MMERPQAPASPVASLLPDGTGAAPLPTLLHESPRLNRHLGIRVLLAIETFQLTGSFKFRAALHLAQHVHEPIILAASSGNFGQALACACVLTGKRSIIVMPQNSARVKVDAVRQYGGQIEFVDPRTQTRLDRVNELRAFYPAAYVASAYDDPLVIAGNSSLGRELAERLGPECDHLVTPVGGGGLASGLIEGFRQAGRRIRVIGAEPEIANDAARSLKAGRIVCNDTEPQTIADGARTVSIGQHNWPILRDGLERIVEVPEARIGEAMRLLFELTPVKAEPTGALGLAGLLTAPDTFFGKTVCCIVSGGNVDGDVYMRLVGPGTA